MTMKEAFETYFEKLNNVWKDGIGCYPMISEDEKNNKDLIISEPDEDGEVEWQPQLQKNEINFSSIINFDLCEELKGFYNTYSFFSLRGKIANVRLYFDPVNAIETVEDTIKKAFENGQYYYPNSQIFVLGVASIDEDDNYILFFDNKTGRLFCYEGDTKKEITISDSLAKTISLMEARI